MNAKEIGIALVMVGLSFFAGRYSAPEIIKEQKTTVSKEDSSKASDKESNQQKIVTVIKQKDGTVIYRTRYIKVKSDLESSSKDTTQMTSEKKEVITRRGVTVSILVGTPISLAPTLAYGVNVQKQVLGPIILGAWGLQEHDGLTAGMSAGLEF